MIEVVTCEICGCPMPKGEEIFTYHGYSGPCPTKPPPPSGWSDTDWIKHLQESTGANKQTR